MKKSTIIITVIVLLVLIGAAIIIFKPSKTTAPSNSDDHSSKTSSGTPADNNTTASVTITYNGSGFSLSADSIKSGQTIKVTNDSSDELSFNSDPHPTHTNNPELNIGTIEPHQSKTVTLKATGKWGFHNHFDASQHGSITVE